MKKNVQNQIRHLALTPVFNVSIFVFLLIPLSVNAIPTLGEAGNFAVLGLEDGSVIINSSTSITGNVGYSRNVTSNTNQKVDTFTGATYVHSTATFSHTPATYAPSSGILTGSTIDNLLDQAVADALSASSAYATLAPISNLGAISDNDSLVLNSSGTVNVFEMSSLNYKEDILELVGQSLDDYFIFNILGNFNFDNSEIKLTGVASDHVIFNFLNASDISINKAGTSFAGTILAPLGVVDYHNPATFDGSIIAKDINLHSDFNISYSSIVVPEPDTLVLLIIGIGLIYAKKFQRDERNI